MAEQEFDPFAIFDKLYSFFEGSEFPDFLLPFLFLFFLFYLSLSFTSIFAERSKLKVGLALILALILSSSKSFLNWFYEFTRTLAGPLVFLLMIGFFLLLLSQGSKLGSDNDKKDSNN